MNISKLIDRLQTLHDAVGVKEVAVNGDKDFEIELDNKIGYFVNIKQYT